MDTQISKGKMHKVQYFEQKMAEESYLVRAILPHMIKLDVRI